jgi:hypothetical protein
MNRCEYCLEEKDCNEVYKFAGEEPMAEPYIICDSCLTELRMEKLLCKDCYDKWKGNK